MVTTDIQHYYLSHVRFFKMPARKRLASLTTRGPTPLLTAHCVMGVSRTSRTERA
jgi:hypothetical protein